MRYHYRDKDCAWCMRTFEGNTRTKTCSDSCRTLLSRWRRTGKGRGPTNPKTRKERPANG